MKIFGVTYERDIHRIQLAHSLHSVALSFVGVYVPIFLLVHEFTIATTIIFFVVLHLIGLAIALSICPFVMKRLGLVQTLRLSYPFQIAFFIALNLMPTYAIPWPVVAALGGGAIFLYWVPLNILLVRHADEKKMGSDLGVFFALPKIFGIVGPLISATLIPFVGFWPMFLVAGFGVALSYLPLFGIIHQNINLEWHFSEAWWKLKNRKLLFILEGFDNIIEESEWFWGIFVFLIIGSLSAPGIIGGLESLGGALFALLVGKIANKYSDKLIFIASFSLIILWGIRFFISTPLSAYILSVATAFVMTLFLVSYFSMIYRKIKNDDEETFLILREIPTVMGRMVVFGSILLVASHPRDFFYLPIIAIVILLLFFITKKRQLIEPV